MYQNNFKLYFDILIYFKNRLHTYFVYNVFNHFTETFKTFEIQY